MIIDTDNDDIPIDPAVFEIAAGAGDEVAVDAVSSDTVFSDTVDGEMLVDFSAGDAVDITTLLDAALGEFPRGDAATASPAASEDAAAFADLREAADVPFDVSVSQSYDVTSFTLDLEHETGLFIF